MKKNNFYIYSTILLMYVLPIVSIVIESIIYKNGGLIFLVGKWFVFWAIGVRLFSAGIKQATNPTFTLKYIFGIQNKEGQVVVRELGFANICMGLLGVVSLFVEQFRLPAAITGGLYFGLAGILHIIRKPKGRNEVAALISDVTVFILMVIFTTLNL